MGGAKHSFGIEWMSARQLPNFRTRVQRDRGVSSAKIMADLYLDIDNVNN